MDEACGEFDALIARAGKVSTADAARLEAHLAGCASCRELARLVEPVDSAVAFADTNASEPLADTHGDDTAARRDHDSPEAATDRYRITGEVGRGGIGRVLSARDRVLDRSVALKELFAASDKMRERFLREALITARLQHPSIVPVYDAGHRDGRFAFYAMKLVAGRPLDEAIAEASTLAERLALLPIVLAIADAMSYAHSERIIHRDLKPANVLVGRYGETVVIDWGLAKDLAVDDSEALDAGPYRAASLDQTAAGSLLGTPAYMAPEQAAGRPVDERVDVYALGAILYHAICGTAPHEGTTLEEMVRCVVSGAVRPLTEREPEVPRDLAAIVSKAMALEPSGRYVTAQGLADDLRRYLTGQLVASHTYRAGELLRRWVKRHRAAVTVALGALLVVGVVGIASVLRIVRAREQADEAAAVAIEERSNAERQRNSATEMLAAMLAEQGRAELLAGRPGRAAVYLSEAQARSRDPGVALRTLLAEAMRSVDSERLSLAGHTGELELAAFSRDGTRIVTAGAGRTAKVWDAAAGTVVATLSGRESDITAASFSPDHSRIVTASLDRTARLWDARTGKVVTTFDHPDEVWSAAFGPDGARVVTTGGDGVVRLWDARTAQLLVALEGHHGEVYSAAFSADGARVVTAGEDHTAKVWDAETGRLLVALEGHTDVHLAAFSPDGSQIVTASGDGTARLWDARTGRLAASLQGHTGSVSLAAYSPDGTRVVTASDDHTARLWDARTGALLTSLDGHAAEVHSAAFSPDGARIVTASYDHTARLWDVPTGRLLASFEGHRDDVRSAVFGPDGTQVLTASWDGTAKLWDARPSQLRVSLDDRIASARFSRDGGRVATTAEYDPTVKLRDARSGELLVSLVGHRGEVSSVDFNAAGTRVVTASADRTANVWDAATGKLLVSLVHAGKVRAARFSPDGARVVTTGADPGARIWNANSGELIARLDGTELPHPLPVPDDVSSATFSKDGTRVVTASADGTARIWRTDDGKLVAQLDGHLGPVATAVVSDDGRRVVTASLDHTAKVWDAGTGELLASLDGHTEFVYQARFSPDGTRVVTASSDRTAKLWDAQTGKLQVSLDGHTGEVLAARFSLDGARVVTASADHAARIWDARTGVLLATLGGGTDDLLDVAFTPDGTSILTASRDGAIWVCDVHLEARTPAAIQRIVSARDPWTFSSGGLVPVPPDSKSGSWVDDPVDVTPDQGSAAAGAVAPSDDYTTKVVALLRQQVDLFKETDCDKLAAGIRSFVHANKAQIAELEAWRKTHRVDEAAHDKAMAPVMKDIPGTLATVERCNDNKAFAAAFAALGESFK
ncbi:MAG TPA: protein kinase [Kofleriaceae bacterium]|nr:protein kinase [Kofleriaceae bacterium]